MRAMMFAVLVMAAACAQAAGPVVAAPPVSALPVSAPPVSALSPLAQQIHTDMQRLERELHAPGVVSAAIGDSAELGGGLSVRPLAVVEDSRCPNNVACIWAGRLRLRANVSGQDVEFTLGQALTTQRGSVTLSVVSPGPWAQWPAELGEKSAYRFGFARS